MLLLEGVSYELFVQFWGGQRAAAGQGAVVVYLQSLLCLPSRAGCRQASWGLSVLPDGLQCRR